MDRLFRLERISARAAERPVHCRQQRDHRTSVRRAERDHQLRELESAVERLQKRSRAALHVEHEASQTLRELLAHDARRDQRNRLHGRRRVAKRVQPSIDRRDLSRLAQEHAPDAIQLSARQREREVAAKSRDRIELVERAACVPESAPGHHRHHDSHRRREWREHQRNLVAHAASGVFIDARSRNRVEIECAATSQHRVSERRRLLAIEPAQIRRHQKCRHLIVRYVARHVRTQQRAPLAWLYPPAITFSFDQSKGEH